MILLKHSHLVQITLAQYRNQVKDIYTWLLRNKSATTVVFLTFVHLRTGNFLYINFFWELQSYEILA